MKNKLLLYLFAQEHFDITTLAFYEGKFTSSKEFFAYALIITHHPKIVKDITSMQAQLPRVPYPEKPDMKSLVDLEFKLSDDERKKLDDDVNHLLKKYALAPVWSLPMKVKLLTNKLPVPYNESPIDFSYPIRLLEDVGDEAKISSLDRAIDIVRTGERIRYPCIVIAESVNRKNFRDFIEKKWPEIHSVIKHLPKRKFRDIDLDRFALGVWVFTKKEVKNMKWKDIDNEITKVEDKDENFFGGGELTPSRTDLQKVLDDAKGYFRQIYPL